MDFRGGFENFACRNERIWTLGGRAPGTPPLDPLMVTDCFSITVVGVAYILTNEAGVTDPNIIKVNMNALSVSFSVVRKNKVLASGEKYVRNSTYCLKKQ